LAVNLVFAVAVVLPILGLMVLILLLLEFRVYQAGRTIISRRRFVLRLIAGCLLIGLLAAVFAGIFLLGLRDATGHPQLFLAYWSGCLLIAVALIWVMLADMREVEDRLSQRQHELWRDMARFVADQLAAKERARSPAEGDDPE
jgi:hypothetical protein